VSFLCHRTLDSPEQDTLPVLDIAESDTLLADLCHNLDWDTLALLLDTLALLLDILVLLPDNLVLLPDTPEEER